MEKSKVITTLTSTSCNLNINENGKQFEENKYRGMICLLLHLTASRTDSIFVVCICVRFQASPKESNFSAIMRIMRYLTGTPNVYMVPKGKIVT